MSQYIKEAVGWVIVVAMVVVVSIPWFLSDSAWDIRDDSTKDDDNV